MTAGKSRHTHGITRRGPTVQHRVPEVRALYLDDCSSYTASTPEDEGIRQPQFLIPGFFALYSRCFTLGNLPANI